MQEDQETKRMRMAMAIRINGNKNHEANRTKMPFLAFDLALQQWGTGRINQKEHHCECN
jgi:hypothetical protein